jgi:hypothetical protein
LVTLGVRPRIVNLPVPEEDSIIVDALEFLKSDTVDMGIEEIEVEGDFDRISTNDTDIFDLVIDENAIDTVAVVRKEQGFNIRKINAENVRDFAFFADPASDESRFEWRWLFSITP